jgi:hypothetical protein
MQFADHRVLILSLTFLNVIFIRFTMPGNRHILQSDCDRLPWAKPRSNRGTWLFEASVTTRENFLDSMVKYQLVIDLSEFETYDRALTLTETTG